ncbi:hypothetical protein CYK00_11025 [Neisseria sicca]|uniref:Uncharacterized protein n=1 Tax=Neisseria sicca TaxID=490 RepID=A0A2I1X9L8_NEISI|nr:hypothetical protein CYK00_11025 [Neisseria sicca]
MNFENEIEHKILVTYVIAKVSICFPFTIQISLLVGYSVFRRPLKQFENIHQHKISAFILVINRHNFRQHPADCFDTGIVGGMG